MKRLCSIVAISMLAVAYWIPGVEAARWKTTPEGVAPAEAETPAKKTQARDDKATDAAKVARTRQQIRMLDDLYKTAIVLITEHYVEEPSSLSAASASQAIFEAMRKKGWHDTRLLGFTDVLFNQNNKPKDDFEKAAQEKLLAGAATHEEVVSKNGKQYLRMATSVPVVMEKCVMCHANFKDKEGAIGSLSYTMELID